MQSQSANGASSSATQVSTSAVSDEPDEPADDTPPPRQAIKKETVVSPRLPSLSGAGGDYDSEDERERQLLQLQVGDGVVVWM